MRSLEHLEEVRQRAQSGNLSKQPRFQPDSREAMFTSIYHWIRRADLEEPPYQVDSRKRDIWLSEFWKKEAHLAGVINSVVNIDKNRAWAITGGRNQVNRYTNILRQAEGGEGWRYYINQQAQNYYTTDIGAITELGRDGSEGPLRALYTLDSTLCRLTGHYDKPLRYDNTKDPWDAGDFFRVVSLPSSRERYHGLGYCATSRVLEMAKLMIAIYEHDQEMLGARSPKGLLLLKGISQEQWNNAMAARNAELSAREQEWFGSVGVLASEGIDDIDAKLMALSQLPAGFNIETTTNLLMYCYALCFGYDPIEFWPVSAGALGRGRETEIQHEKATGKGGADFMLSFQDRLQMVMPETIVFEFEQRDAQGMVLEAAVIKAWADVANALYMGGTGVLTREQAASLLVENGIIPAEWTETEEDAIATDKRPSPGGSPEAQMHHLRTRALEDERVRRAAALYPHEPIVRTQWPTGRTMVLWQRGEDALGPRVWQVLGDSPSVMGKPVPRALLGPAASQRAEEDAVLFEGEDFTITEVDVEQAIEQGHERVGDAFAELLTARALTEAEIDMLDGGQNAD
jgi:hypothetical protein